MTYEFMSPRQTIGTLFAIFCGISHEKPWSYIILVKILAVCNDFYVMKSG